MGKRILFLTPQLPYPPQQGTAIRNYNLIAQVARWHSVHLLAFVDSSDSADPGPLRELCASVRSVPAPQHGTWRRLQTALTSPLPDMAHRLASAAFQRELEALLLGTSIEVVQVEGLEMARYGLWARQRGAGAPRLIFDAHNAEYLLQQRIFEADSRRPRRWLGATYSWLQWQKLRRYEAAVCRQAEQVIACSPADAEALARLVPGLQTSVVPNGVDTESYRPGVVPAAALGQYALVFTGKMDFRPNVDAILWFCSEVLPAIRQAEPQAQLYVVGKNPHPRLAALVAQPGVTLTGYVDDVRPYIAAASVYVVPLLTGGGTRLKVLEAMAMGKAIVSTTLGCEGIPVIPGREVVLANSPAEVVAQVLALLQNPRRREELGRAARAFVEQHFNWRMVTAPLEQVYER
jgi:sugar transferase (PEP-CTERM/EpsH1 system associated)